MGFPFLEIAQPAAPQAVGFHRIKKKKHRLRTEDRDDAKSGVNKEKPPVTPRDQGQLQAVWTTQGRWKNLIQDNRTAPGVASVGRCNFVIQ